LTLEYHYVLNEEVLLDPMIDLVCGEIRLPTTDVDWLSRARRPVRRSSTVKFRGGSRSAGVLPASRRVSDQT
jgi:hypothetical protein